MMNHGKDQTVAHQAADVVDEVADGIRSAAHSVGGTVRNTAHAVRDAAGRAAGAVGDTYEEVGQYARDSLKRGRDRVRSLEESFESSVSENPKTSLLIAAAIGVAIGAWWKRR
jgi:ElaB/YqjD/DUF883 family membrane-anchored ribosome-binding protein